MTDLLEVEFTGLEDTQLFLMGVNKALSIDELADEGGAILLNRIRTRFLDETDPDGIKWIESQAAKRRKSTGRGGGTLFDTGTLFHSIQLFKKGTGERAIATDVPYAPKHQRGEGQVKREFLGFSLEDNIIIKNLVLSRLDRARKNG